MLLFLLGMAILVIGYFTYGRFVEKILGPGRPADAMPDLFGRRRFRPGSRTGKTC